MCGGCVLILQGYSLLSGSIYTYMYLMSCFGGRVWWVCPQCNILPPLCIFCFHMVKVGMWGGCVLNITLFLHYASLGFIPYKWACGGRDLSPQRDCSWIIVDTEQVSISLEAI